MNIYFKLYENDSLTLRYTFPVVQYTNLPAPEDNFVEVGGIRGDNVIIVPGSKKPWDLIIRGIFRGNNWTYEDVTSAIDAMETALQFAEPYYVKVDKVEGGASKYSYKVKRLLPIEYSESLRNGKQVQGYTVTLRVNSW